MTFAQFIPRFRAGSSALGIHPWRGLWSRWVALVVVLMLALGRAVADPTPALREYDVLKSLPSGWLEWLSQNDLPDDHGLAGGNRGQGRWIEAGSQRGSCRAVIAAVVAGDLARADRAWKGVEVTFEHQRDDGGFAATERPSGGVQPSAALPSRRRIFSCRNSGGRFW